MTIISTANAALTNPGDTASSPLTSNYASVLGETDSFPNYTGVIDIGSGSARAVVMQVHPGGGVEIVAQKRVTLNLMSHLGSDGRLDAVGVAGTLDALEDFALVARAYGIETIHAVATAAVRESGNAAAITSAAEERFGIPLRIIDGSDEAAYCFIGGIHGLRTRHGLLADIGGGSTEIVQFRDRALASSVSLPLGSLRIANQFNLLDRPSDGSVRAACDYVRSILEDAGIQRLPDDGMLVGSGGSVRLLTRLDRGRKPYPIIKLHGYELAEADLVEQIREMAAMSRIEREDMPGMNPERSHSIVGGGVVAHALMQHLETDRLLVSGQGLREGLARHPEPPSACQEIQLPPLESVRMESLTDLVGRFAPRFGQRGERRAALAGRIAEVVWGDNNRQMANSLRCASTLLDIGNAVDFYNRFNRTASIIVRTDLPGYTHAESAQIAAILLAAEFMVLPHRFRKSDLLSADDLRLIEQAAVILVAADELDGRLAQGTPANAVTIGQESGTWQITTPGWSSVAAPDLPVKWKRAFAEDLRIERYTS